MAGRPVGRGGRRTTSSFAVPQDKLHLIDEMDTIAAREGVSRSEIIIKALEEYNERHGPGNSQTVLTSYGPGGRKSLAQIEQEIINDLAREKEVQGRDLNRKIWEQLTVRGQEFVAARGRIINALKKKGVKTWL